jgi:hypothetical protein
MFAGAHFRCAKPAAAPRRFSCCHGPFRWWLKVRRARQCLCRRRVLLPLLPSCPHRRCRRPATPRRRRWRRRMCCRRPFPRRVRAWRRRVCLCCRHAALPPLPVARIAAAAGRPRLTGGFVCLPPRCRRRRPVRLRRAPIHLPAPVLVRMRTNAAAGSHKAAAAAAAAFTAAALLPASPLPPAGTSAPAPLAPPLVLPAPFPPPASRPAAPARRAACAACCPHRRCSWPTTPHRRLCLSAAAAPPPPPRAPAPRPHTFAGASARPHARQRRSRQPQSRRRCTCRICCRRLFGRRIHGRLGCYVSGAGAVAAPALLRESRLPPAGLLPPLMPPAARRPAT